MGKANYLPVINRTGSYKLDISDIRLIIRERRKIRFDTRKGAISTYDDMDNIASYLDENTFVRCMNSCIVNLDRVACMYDMSIFFDDGTSFRVGRDNFIKVKQKYNSYLLRLEHSE